MKGLKLIRIFILSAGVVFLTTALAKALSSMGHSRVLDLRDPILLLPTRILLQLVALLEAVVAALCFWSKNIKQQIGLVLWLSLSFLMYRVLLILIGYTRPCICMGNIADAISIPQNLIDSAMRYVLAYLLIGSLVCSLLLCQRNAKQS